MLTIPNLNKRETNILAGAGLFLILFVAFEFIYMPAVDKKNHLIRLQAQKTDAVKEMQQLQDRYQAMNRQMDHGAQAVANRNKNFSLFSFLDLKAQQSGIKEHVAYMKPSTKTIENASYHMAMVTVKLEGISLKECLTFLSLIEAEDSHVEISSLSLSKAGKDKKRLDAIIQTQTIIPGDGK